MERDYDLFEVLADGAPMWRQRIAGQENAREVPARKFRHAFSARRASDDRLHRQRDTRVRITRY
jgi:hypothetical protein